jgi:hypothetical protein
MLQYMKYLAYLPVLVQLITLIRTAERSFRGANTGADKARWVAEQFGMLVTVVETTGLIGAKPAAALRNGSAAIIKAVVDVMQDVHGGVPPLEGDDAAVTEPFQLPNRAWNIGDELTQEPSKDDVQSGEDVYQRGTDPVWTVRQHGSADAKLAAPWRLVFTKK